MVETLNTRLCQDERIAMALLLGVVQGELGQLAANPKEGRDCRPAFAFKADVRDAIAVPLTEEITGFARKQRYTVRLVWAPVPLVGAVPEIVYMPQFIFTRFKYGHLTAVA